MQKPETFSQEDWDAIEALEREYRATNGEAVETTILGSPSTPEQRKTHAEHQRRNQALTIGVFEDAMKLINYELHKICSTLERVALSLEKMG